MVLKFIKNNKMDFIKGYIGNCCKTPDLFYKSLERLITKGIITFNIIIIHLKINNIIYKVSGSDSEDNREEEGSIQVDHNNMMDYLELLNTEPNVLNGYIIDNATFVRSGDG